MKIIHCADLHLDSSLQTHLSREKAKRRRDELLRNFERLAQYASAQGVEVILISGDLFDKDTVSALAGNMVLSVIAAHPEIRFYYLRGNHDTGDCLRQFADGPRAERSFRDDSDAGGQTLCAPENLFLFGPRWKTYFEGKKGSVAITGIELSRENGAFAHASLRLDPERFNIVMMHGQTDSGTGAAKRNDLRRTDLECAAAGTLGRIDAGTTKRNDLRRTDPDFVGRAGDAGTISLGALRGRGIDYLALGHIHGWKKGRLDSRGIYCYPGCLEGRGFDECGEHGFALLEIDEMNRLTGQYFVPFAQRVLHCVEADVTGCRTTAEMALKISDMLREKGCAAKDMADVILCGELDVDCEKDTGYLETVLSDSFFFARLRDRTSMRIDIEDYLHDESLRGEFVRHVMEDESVPESEKNEVIRLGFMAMDGEELF